MIDTFAHGFSAGGVTFFHVFPPSVVTWIRPSSVPTQMRPASSGDGAMV